MWDACMELMEAMEPKDLKICKQWKLWLYLVMNIIQAGLIENINNEAQI